MGDWISVKDKLPEPGQKVIAYYLNQQGKVRRIMAVWAKKFTIEAYSCDDGDGIELEYNEVDGMNYLPEGWYEKIECAEFSFCSVDAEITYWMQLPKTQKDMDKQWVAENDI